ncbi:MAG: bifunctional glutamate N-acetyltransferase/amino-acid acetyltransferase ArgJ [Chromatiales bacterium]|jgi:glutamate N-acetyltransferase/amino-acid N-acetyltransferase
MSEASFAVPGVRLGVAAAGIKYPDRQDMLVVELAAGGRAAAVFTRNAFCAAPVHLARAHLQSTTPRYLLVNSGNANAGTGEQGMRDAESSCRYLAEVAGCRPEQVLPFSTGVIGENLPLERMQQAMPAALADLRIDGWEAAARAIMTTDTRPKLAERHFEIDGISARVVGIAKGAGMIRPDMATMLAYLATDLAVDNSLLQACLEAAVEPSFNSITVDGDTSTNDACVLLASATSSLPPVNSGQSEAYRRLAEAVSAVCLELAREIVRDGEGATKLVEVVVEQAAGLAEARKVAYTIAHSPLVKTALFACDPNWGRILAAVGRADLQKLEIERVEIWLDHVCIVRDGGRAPEYTEAAGRSVMEKPEFRIRVRLGRGAVETRVLTCDLSYDYVRINAEYRT